MSVAQNRPDCVALLGFGNVGLGGAANYLAKGFEVRAFDPIANSEVRAAKFPHAAWPSLKALGLTEVSEYPAHRLFIVGTSADAVRDACFIHENGPEDVKVKRAILSEAEDAADASAIIASSSGGLPPSTLQSEMRRPERFLIMHPFNPPISFRLSKSLAATEPRPARSKRRCPIFASSEYVRSSLSARCLVTSPTDFSSPSFARRFIVSSKALPARSP